MSRRARAQADEAGAPPSKAPTNATKGRSRKKAADAQPDKKSEESPKAKAPSKKQTAKRNARSKQSGANTTAAWNAFRRAHPLGAVVTATVESFSSHGAYARAGDASVYLPLRLLGDPAPRRARNAVAVGETRDFVVHRFDDDRRGIDAGIVPLGPSTGKSGSRHPRPNRPQGKAPPWQQRRQPRRPQPRRHPPRRQQEDPSQKAPAKRQPRRPQPRRHPPEGSQEDPSQEGTRQKSAKKTPARKAPAKGSKKRR